MKPERIWYGSGTRDRSARVALAPAAALYGAAIAARNKLYDSGLLRTHASSIPVISVGNLTVGGTGKTPFTAYIVARLTEIGMKPAIVMRGYGEDEKLLHEWLNPGVRVCVSPDRVAGIRHAAASGADVAVLDDGFQHRRAARSLDVVLVSAEQWRDNLALLPAGPLREPLKSLRRADVVVVTSKSASDAEAALVASRVGEIVPEVPVVRASFLLRDLARVGESNETRSLGELVGADVLAIAGVGEPASFVAQLSALCASVTPRIFADHHGYTSTEAASLADEARHHKYAVTTGKDAVKLGPAWPAKAPGLWYVSQAVQITDGLSVFARALRDAVSR